MSRKIGIMGGTFNPIHTGHLILGESAATELGLDLVLYMPAGNPPHKTIKNAVRDEERVDMVRLAIAANEHFALSLHDMNQDGYCYTYRMLEELKAQHPEDELYFIMGADSLFDFDTWLKPERIAAACRLVVAIRNHAEAEAFKEAIRHVETAYQADIRVLTTPNIDISSHEIRRKVSEKRSIRYYVPDSVRQYILDHQLYLDDENED